mmetsp:Transcript_29602/g.54534  ORF Transcript_29602/g.54534 Transcript_29602/m.54534 type:complete len:429 (-) Transcript_29602:207-1493(-)
MLSSEAVKLIEEYCGYVAYFCCAVAASLSMYQIFRHCQQKYASPRIQGSIVRIIGFVVWYSLDSAASMHAFYWQYRVVGRILKVLREVYEAITVLAFVTLVISCMGGKKEIRKQVEKERQKPEHPFLFGFAPARKIISAEDAPLSRYFRKLYKPGISMIITILIGIVQFAFVLIGITVIHSTLTVVYTQILKVEEPKLIDKGLNILKIVSTTVAMYQIFMLDETLETNNGMKERYHQMQPHLKFLFFKIPILFSMWVDAGCKFAVQFFDADDDKETFWNSFFIAMLMFIFSILNFWAFPPEQLIAVQDNATGNESKSQTIAMLKDIRKFRRLHQQRTSCLQALIGFHDALKYLDLDGDGKVDKEELRYLCECAGIDKDRVDKLFKDLGVKEGQTELDLKKIFPHWHPEASDLEYVPPSYDGWSTSSMA